MVAEPKTRQLGPLNDESYAESNSYIINVKNLRKRQRQIVQLPLKQ